jgi:hypothetical protein
VAYETTSVAVERSQAEIRKLMVAHGARSFSFSEGVGPEGLSWGVVEFVMHDQRVRLQVPIIPPTEAEVRARATKAKVALAKMRANRHEYEAMRVWRVLFHAIKARLVGVEDGLETFEQAFLSHLVDPVSGRTVWEAARPAIEAGALKLNGPGLRALNP